MPHTLPSSIASVPPVSPNRALRRWLARELVQLRPAIAASATACAAERYRKHFDSFAHACLLLFHGLSGSPSLRQSYAGFAACPGLVALAGLGTVEEERLRLSFSTLAASSTSRPSGFLSGLLPTLMARVQRQGGAGRAGLPATLCVLDSTFLRLSTRLAPWLGLSARSKRPGVSVQVQDTPALDLPAHVLITDAHTPDVRGLDQAILDDPARLAALRGHTLVVDLGYYSHARFARLRAAGVHLVTRLHPQAARAARQEEPLQQALPAVDAGRITVQRDARVTLGSPRHHRGTVLPGLRVVEALVTPTPAAARRGAQPVLYRLLTDRWDLSAHDVVQL